MACVERNYVHYNEHGDTMLSHLHQLYIYSMFLDACLVCNGTEIFAHKAVLAAASPTLRERLHEFGDCPHVRIEIEQELLNLDINAEDVKLLIEYIYKGQVHVPEQRLAVFLELGNYFQILGLYNQATNTGSHLSLLSQPLSNYNLSQSLFSTIPSQESFTFDELTSFPNDCLINSHSDSVLSPEKLSDSIVKSDKSLPVSVIDSAFSSVCNGTTLLDSFHILTSRTSEQISEESNSKLPCDLQNFINVEGITEDYATNSFPQSDLSENSQHVQSEHSKDIFEDPSALSSPGASDPEMLVNSLSNQPNSFFVSSELFPTNPTTNSCLGEETFQPCKIPNGTLFPERQLRLKVKDSIGGVSLQDTSRGERHKFHLQEETSCNVSFAACDQNQVSYEVELVQTLTEENCEILCPQCTEKFVDTDDLTLHLWEEHKTGKEYHCLFCSFKTVIENRLVEHGKGHLKSSDRQCCICGKKFKTRATLRNHLFFHASDKWFKCDKCSAHYSQRNNLLRHMASEHRLDTEGCPLKEKLSCQDCSFQTWAPHKLKDHRNRCHTQDKRFKCSECSYSSTEKTSLVKHVRTHTQERPYICDFCGIRFVTVSSLKRHSRSHTKEKPYKCKDCGQQYADKKRLHDHHLKHKSLKPFKCPYCEYYCRRKDNLQSHVKRTHPPVRPEQTEEVETAVSADHSDFQSEYERNLSHERLVDLI